MRNKIQLTDYQKKFIRDNLNKLTYEEIADEIGLESVFVARRFCSENGLVKKIKCVMSEGQKQFIRDNYKTMRELDIVKKFEIPRSAIQRFKRSEGLNKQFRDHPPVKKKVFNPDYFDVDARECWAI